MKGTSRVSKWSPSTSSSDFAFGDDDDEQLALAMSMGAMGGATSRGAGRSIATSRDAGVDAFGGLEGGEVYIRRPGEKRTQSPSTSSASSSAGSGPLKAKAAGGSLDSEGWATVPAMNTSPPPPPSPPSSEPAEGPSTPSRSIILDQIKLMLESPPGSSQDLTQLDEQPASADAPGHAHTDTGPGTSTDAIAGTSTGAIAGCSADVDNVDGGAEAVGCATNTNSSEGEAGVASGLN